MTRRTALFAPLVFLLLFSASAQAQESEFYIPDGLRPWARWVLDRDPSSQCPLVNGTRECFWPGSVQLEVTEAGAQFRQIVSLTREGKVAIPGGAEIFPLDLRIAGKNGEQAVPVLTIEGRPAAQLPPGIWTLTGRFSWSTLPQTLLLPKDIGLVSLSISGVSIPHPRLNENGELWLRDASENGDAEEDTLRINVSRLLSDGLPFRMTTLIELRVGGKAREVNLGRVLPSGFVPVSSQSELIHAFSKENSVIVQLRPGVHRFVIEALRSEPPKEIEPPALELAEWPVDELWVWHADESIRSVTIAGAPGIDPQRTSLDEEWKRHPVYAVSKGTKLTFAETRRGEQDQAPNQLSLHRRFWLDLNGEGYTIDDQISGRMSQQWRLNMNTPTVLSRVEVNGQAQLITKDSRENVGKSGVEVRSPDLSLHGVARLEGTRSRIPAVGWDHDMSSLSAQLMLPPGWQVIEIFGTDSNAGTWLSSWTLWDLFFLVLISIVVHRLKSPLLGIVTFAALGLSHEIPGAPHYAWLNVLCGFALVRGLPDGSLRRFARWYLAASCIFISLLLVCFAIDQLRSGIFPQLGSEPLIDQGTLWNIITGLLAVAAIVGGAVVTLTAVIQLFTGQFRRFFRSVLLMLLAIIVFSFASTFLGGRASFPGSKSRQFADYGVQSRIAQLDAPAAPHVPQPRTAPAESGMEEQAVGTVEPADDTVDAFGGRLESNTVQRQQLLQIDQKAVVQTGVGVPSWAWKTWTLGWNGPVERNREIEILLLSPRMNLVLSVLRVLLFIYLLLSFARESLSQLQTRGLGKALVIGTLLCGIASTPPKVQAQEFPGDTLLKELEARFAERRCKTDCLAPNSVKLSLAAGQPGGLVPLSVDAVTSSGEVAAWPIPGPLSEYVVTSVQLDGVASDELRRDEAGMLWLRVPKGVHRIHVEGSLARRNSVTLQFGLVPQHVEIIAKDWIIDGLSETGSVSESVQLVRQGETSERKEEVLENQAEAPLPNWYFVSREITLGQPWTIATTVSRLGSNERAEMMKLPLLPGESVTDERMKVEAGNVLVSFPRGEGSLAWSSTFREEPKFSLTAPSGNNVTEEWKLRCSSIWRCAFDGILPIHTIEGPEYLVDFRPWPGEKLNVSVAKPLGVEGLTETVTHALLHWDPGTGFLRGTLTFGLRSSQGGFRKVTLPEKALVQQVAKDGAPVNITPKGGVLEIPLQPGEHEISINWQQPWQATFATRLPEVDLGSNAYNITVSSSVPAKRWLLWTAGPEWGPAVLFWGGLLVVILFGIIVGRAGVPPLSAFEWIVLGLGTATLHPAILLAPVGWCALLAWKKQHPPESKKWFNGLQILLVAASFAVFLLLFASLYCGLIVDPDMGVSGQGSTRQLLRWYLDRTPAALPQPLIIWLPMWVYRAFMLVWSTWLVFLLMRWIRWTWTCLAAGGWWKK